MRGFWISITLVAVLALASPIFAAEPATGRPQTVEPQETDLGDVVVEGATREQLARRFVEQAARPVRGRGLARWTGPVCIGVVNFRTETARAIADRVATRAADLGVQIADAPCEQNLVIVGAADGAEMADAWVERRPEDFGWNVTGSHDRPSALRRFRTSDDPVRWWQISLPMYFDILTGHANPAVRLPGGPPATIIVYAKSQLRGRTRDDLLRSVVIVDVPRAEALTTQQLCDYLVMVAFAQIDPDADTTDFETILNVFDTPAATPAMTVWDEAYLRALYTADDTARLNPLQQASALARGLDAASEERPGEPR